MVKRFARMSRPSSRPRTRPASPTSSSATSSSVPNTRPTSPTSRPRTATPPPSAPQSLENNLEEIAAKLNLIVLQDKEKAKKQNNPWPLNEIKEAFKGLSEKGDISLLKLRLLEEFEGWSDREILVFNQHLMLIRTENIRKWFIYNYRDQHAFTKIIYEHQDAIHDDVNESLNEIKKRLDILSENQIGIMENQKKIMYELKIITDSMKKSKK